MISIDCTFLKVSVRSSKASDIDTMVSLSKAKRLAYEKVQPQFWRSSGEAGDNSQRQWFKELLEAKDYVMFSAVGEYQELLGFVIGKFIPAPEVYNPGGVTLMVDDFCVKSENLWSPVGGHLIESLKNIAKRKGAAQILVVCGTHDSTKREFLMCQNLSVASEWFVGSIK